MGYSRTFPIAIQRTGRQKDDSLVKPLKDATLAGGKYLAPRGTHKHGSGRNVSGPRLASAWKVDQLAGPTKLKVTITNTKKYAATIATGSARHRIPKYGFRRLYFTDWPRGHASPRLRRKFPHGEFFFKNVHHPGNKRPVRFLQTP